MENHPQRLDPLAKEMRVRKVVPGFAVCLAAVRGVSKEIGSGVVLTQVVSTLLGATMELSKPHGN